MLLQAGMLLLPRPLPSQPTLHPLPHPTTILPPLRWKTLACHLIPNDILACLIVPALPLFQWVLWALFPTQKACKCWTQSQLIGSISRTTPTSLNHLRHSLGSIQTVVNSQVLAAVDMDNIRVLQHIHLHMELDIHPADTHNTKLNLMLVKPVQSVDIR